MMSIEQLRQDALGIFQKALSAVDPKAAVRRALTRDNGTLRIEGATYRLKDYEHIYLIGGGKASAVMAAAVEELLGDTLSAGQVTTKYGHGVDLKATTLVEAGHPLPDEVGMAGTRKIMALLERSGPRDLVIAVISGGASALMPLPVEPLSLSVKQAVTQALLACGADIKEINVIRKHLSQVKGGQLARAAAPATLICLVISDVIGDPLESIASGLSVGDPSTYADCLSILDKYNLGPEIPPNVVAHLEKGARGEIADTPTPDDPIFRAVHNAIIATNRQAVGAACNEAQRLGYKTLILSTFVAGETREIARMHGAITKEIRTSGHPLAPPACIISGGETTVTLTGPGLGGRNQEFALAAALEIENLPNTVIFSAGTDGSDGPTDAAGGMVDGTTLSRARRLGLDAARHLKANDAYHFLKPLNDLVITGPTRTNVMDVHLVLVG